MHEMLLVFEAFLIKKKTTTTKITNELFCFKKKNPDAQALSCKHTQIIINNKET